MLVRKLLHRFIQILPFIVLAGLFLGSWWGQWEDRHRELWGIQELSLRWGHHVGLSPILPSPRQIESKDSNAKTVEGRELVWNPLCMSMWEQLTFFSHPPAAN